VIAWPVAYWVMSRWLQNFAYRTGINIRTYFLAGGIALLIALLTVSHQAVRASLFLAGGIALLIALLTVSHQAVRASLADPVKSLKYE